MNLEFPSIVIESRVQLFTTLAEAAEIEHNLMCLYLYGMFSLKRDISEGISAEELKAVDRWRRVILGVALEEMNHLTLVSNLAVSVGASPQFARPNFPAYPGMYPANIVMELAAFNLDTLEHFIYLERPRSMEIQDGDSFVPDLHYQREAPHGRLNPHAGDYKTIGELYLTIRHSLTDLCKHYGEKNLFCGSTKRQIGPLDAPLPGLRLITDRKSAEEALDTIVTQGEGALTIEGSHFARFKGIKDEYVELLKKNPNFVPARAVARNPVMRKPVDPQARVWVREPLAAQYMDLANALYLLFVRLLGQVYAFEDRDPDNKKLLLGISFQTMHAMAHVGETLTHLQANIETPNVFAGMSFAMARSMAPMDRGSERTILIERLGEIEEHFKMLQTDLEKMRDTSSTMNICIEELSKMKTLFHQIRENVTRGFAPPETKTKAAPQTDAPPKPKARPLSHGPSYDAPAPAPSPNVALDMADSSFMEVTFETKKCMHARHCVTELPKVFLANTPGRWIFPDQADPEMLAAVIQKCPSGALQYRRHDGRPDESEPEVNMLRLRENGPYAFNAEMRVDGKNVGYRATLCRCGQSSSKPFCDGTHVSVAFQCTGEAATVDPTSLDVRNGPLEIRRTHNGPLHLQGPIEICAGTGRIILRTKDVHLCRCGHSKNKPICDSSHVIAGFIDPVPTDTSVVHPAEVSHVDA